MAQLKNKQIKVLTSFDFNSQKAINVLDPTLAQDAATKNYVDTQVATVDNSVPTQSDKAKVPAATSGNDQDSTLTIAATPSGNGYVMVLVNGSMQELGDGVKTKDCYFTGDSGTTARAISAIVATDKFYWNGVISGFDLAVTDKVDFQYNV